MDCNKQCDNCAALLDTIQNERKLKSRKDTVIQALKKLLYDRDSLYHSAVQQDLKKSREKFIMEKDIIRKQLLLSLESNKGLIQEFDKYKERVNILAKENKQLQYSVTNYKQLVYQLTEEGKSAKSELRKLRALLKENKVKSKKEKYDESVDSPCDEGLELSDGISSLGSPAPERCPEALDEVPVSTSSLQSVHHDSMKLKCDPGTPPVQDPDRSMPSSLNDSLNIFKDFNINFDGFDDDVKDIDVDLFCNVSESCGTSDLDQALDHPSVKNLFEKLPRNSEDNLQFSLATDKGWVDRNSAFSSISKTEEINSSNKELESKIPTDITVVKDLKFDVTSSEIDQRRKIKSSKPPPEKCSQTYTPFPVKSSVPRNTYNQYAPHSPAKVVSPEISEGSSEISDHGYSTGTCSPNEELENNVTELPILDACIDSVEGLPALCDLTSATLDVFNNGDSASNDLPNCGSPSNVLIECTNNCSGTDVGDAGNTTKDGIGSVRSDTNLAVGEISDDLIISDSDSDLDHSNDADDEKRCENNVRLPEVIPPKFTPKLDISAHVELESDHDLSEYRLTHENSVTGLEASNSGHTFQTCELSNNLNCAKIPSITNEKIQNIGTPPQHTCTDTTGMIQIEKDGHQPSIFEDIAPDIAENLPVECVKNCITSIFDQPELQSKEPNQPQRSFSPVGFEFSKIDVSFDKPELQVEEPNRARSCNQAAIVSSSCDQLMNESELQAKEPNQPPLRSFCPVGFEFSKIDVSFEKPELQVEEPNQARSCSLAAIVASSCDQLMNESELEAKKLNLSRGKSCSPVNFKHNNSDDSSEEHLIDQGSEEYFHSKSASTVFSTEKCSEGDLGSVLVHESSTQGEQSEEVVLLGNEKYFDKNCLKPPVENECHDPISSKGQMCSEEIHSKLVNVADICTDKQVIDESAAINLDKCLDVNSSVSDESNYLFNKDGDSAERMELSEDRTETHSPEPCSIVLPNCKLDHKFESMKDDCKIDLERCGEKTRVEFAINDESYNMSCSDDHLIQTIEDKANRTVNPVSAVTSVAQTSCKLNASLFSPENARFTSVKSDPVDNQPSNPDKTKRFKSDSSTLEAFENGASVDISDKVQFSSLYYGEIQNFYLPLADPLSPIPHSMLNDDYSVSPKRTSFPPNGLKCEIISNYPNENCFDSYDIIQGQTLPQMLSPLRATPLKKKSGNESNSTPERTKVVKFKLVDYSDSSEEDTKPAFPLEPLISPLALTKSDPKPIISLAKKIKKKKKKKKKKRKTKISETECLSNDHKYPITKSYFPGEYVNITSYSKSKGLLGLNTNPSLSFKEQELVDRSLLINRNDNQCTYKTPLLTSKGAGESARKSKAKSSLASSELDAHSVNPRDLDDNSFLSWFSSLRKNMSIGSIELLTGITDSPSAGMKAVVSGKHTPDVDMSPEKESLACGIDSGKVSVLRETECHLSEIPSKSYLTSEKKVQKGSDGKSKVSPFNKMLKTNNIGSKPGKSLECRVERKKAKLKFLFDSSFDSNDLIISRRETGIQELCEVVSVGNCLNQKQSNCLNDSLGSIESDSACTKSPTNSPESNLNCESLDGMDCTDASRVAEKEYSPDSDSKKIKPANQDTILHDQLATENIDMNSSESENFKNVSASDGQVNVESSEFCQNGISEIDTDEKSSGSSCAHQITDIVNEETSQNIECCSESLSPKHDIETDTVSPLGSLDEIKLDLDNKLNPAPCFNDNLDLSDSIVPGTESGKNTVLHVESSESKVDLELKETGTISSDSIFSNSPQESSHTCSQQLITSSVQPSGEPIISLEVKDNFSRNGCDSGLSYIGIRTDNSLPANENCQILLLSDCMRESSEEMCKPDLEASQELEVNSSPDKPIDNQLSSSIFPIDLHKVDSSVGILGDNLFDEKHSYSLFSVDDSASTCSVDPLSFKSETDDSKACTKKCELFEEKHDNSDEEFTVNKSSIRRVYEGRSEKKPLCLLQPFKKNIRKYQLPKLNDTYRKKYVTISCDFNQFDSDINDLSLFNVCMTYQTLKISNGTVGGKNSGISDSSKLDVVEILPISSSCYGKESVLEKAEEIIVNENILSEISSPAERSQDLPEDEIIPTRTVEALPQEIAIDCEETNKTRNCFGSNLESPASPDQECAASFDEGITITESQVEHHPLSIDTLESSPTDGPNANTSKFKQVDSYNRLRLCAIPVYSKRNTLKRNSCALDDRSSGSCDSELSAKKRFNSNDFNNTPYKAVLSGPISAYNLRDGNMYSDSPMSPVNSACSDSLDTDEDCSFDGAGKLIIHDSLEMDVETGKKEEPEADIISCQPNEPRKKSEKGLTFFDSYSNIDLKPTDKHIKLEPAQHPVHLTSQGFIPNEQQQDQSTGDRKQLNARNSEDMNHSEVSGLKPTGPLGFYKELSEVNNDSDCDDQLPELPCPIEESTIQELDVPEQFTELPAYNPDLVSCDTNVLDFALEYWAQQTLKLHEKQPVKLFCSKKDSALLEKCIMELMQSSEISVCHLKMMAKKIKHINADHIADILVDAVSVDYGELVLANSPPAPPLTTFQQRLILLLFFLSEGQSHYYKTLLDSISESVFTFKTSKDNPGMNELDYAYENLIKFHTAVCRQTGLMEVSRAFLYDILYKCGHRSLSYALHIIQNWLEILPTAKLANNCLLTETIVFLLKNAVGPKTDCSKFDQQKANLRFFFDEIYEYPSTGITKDQLAAKLVENLHHKGASEAFVLLCKREPYPSMVQIVEKQLFPILNNWLQDPDPAKEILTSIALVTLGRTLRASPLKILVFVRNAMDLIAAVLNQHTSLRVSEAAIESLCLLRRYDMFSCAKILAKWSPTDGNVTTGMLGYIKTLLHPKKIVDWKKRISRMTS